MMTNACPTMPFVIETLSTESPKADVLAKLGYDTFLETFGPYQEPEDINTYLAKAFNIKQIQGELSDNNNRFYLVSNPIGEVIGYAKLVVQPKEIDSCITSSRPMFLNRFYFTKEAQGTGAAQTLFEVCLNTAKKEGATSLWLGVWSKNHRAIRFYEKYGFKVVGTRWFQMGAVQEEDHIMELSL